MGYFLNIELRKWWFIVPNFYTDFENIWILGIIEVYIIISNCIWEIMCCYAVYKVHKLCVYFDILQTVYVYARGSCCFHSQNILTQKCCRNICWWRWIE